MFVGGIMKIPDLEKKNKYTIAVLLFLIYILGVLIYFSLGNYNKCLCFTPDERYYIQVSKAISNGDGMCYNGLVSTFQKVFYPIILAPAYKINNLHIQIRVVSLLGILFELSSIFPIYLICKRLGLNRLKSLLICLLSFSIPTFLYSMTFMSETAFLALWLWEIYLVVIMMDDDKTITIVPILLGVIGYALYLCKEVGIVALPALCLTKLIFMLKEKKGHIKDLLPLIISVLVFIGLFIIGRFFVFQVSSGAYSYSLSFVKNSESSDKNPLYFFLYSILYYLGYIVLVNNVFPLFIRSQKDDLNSKLSMYIEIVILTLILVVVYKITLKEDFGVMSPRLHFRYFEPLFIPYFICFISRVDELKEEDILCGKYIRLAFIIYLLIIMMLPGVSSGEFLDSTTTMVYLIPEKLAYHFFKGNISKNVIMNFGVKFIVLVAVIIETRLLKKNKKLFLKVFLVIAILINISGSTMKYCDIRKEYELSEDYVVEMQELNDALSDLSGKKLIIARQFTRLSAILITYYDIYETDTYLSDEEYEVTDKSVTLKAGGGVSREANIDDYAYIVYENGVWEDSERESIPPEKILFSTEHFFIVEN